jgi:hypothetical protein
MEEIYSEFLGTADLAVWQKCLDKYGELVRAATNGGRISLGQLAQGLCIAQYTRWFAMLAGEEEASKRAGDTFEQLAEAAGSYDLGGSSEGILVNSVIAAGRGYRAAARAMVRSTGQEAPVEITLLMMPDAPAKAAGALKERIHAGRTGRSFLPAVTIYAHALLKLGYLQQLQELLDQFSPVASNPLMIDLQANLHELTGAWP